jgi:Zn-dependent protease
MEPSSPWFRAPVKAPPTEPNGPWFAAPVQRPSTDPAGDWLAAPGQPQPTRDEEPTGPRFGEPKPSLIKRTVGPAIAAIIAFFAKFKAILLLIVKVKMFATIGTMLVSLAAYAWIWGVPFAAGFIALLFVHELGHVIQLRREGIKASAPMFIPFMGAVISARSLGDNALAEARVGLAGPILGSIGAAACIFVWHATGSDIWRALAFTGFFLNLFNLLPVVLLDGGRAMAAMAPWMWFLGFAALIPLVFVFPNPIILLILVFAGYETTRRWKQRRAGGAVQEAYYRVKPLNRALVAAVYLGLIGLLVLGMHATALTRTFN